MIVFPISDLPPAMPIEDIRTSCSVEAGIHYEIPADLIYAVALNEGGKVDSKVKNTNGSYDLGMMQFNTTYLKTLEKEGIKSSDVMKNNCYPFHLAGWRIKAHLAEPGDDIFKKVAFYHSRTEKYNQKYRDRLLVNIKRFPRDVAKMFFDLIVKRLDDYFKHKYQVNE